MGREVKGSNLHHRRSGLHHLDRFAKAILLKARCPLPPRGDAAGACFRRCYNLPMLLPPRNEIFVPASEPRNPIYA
jgi:hypothetical protein